jgi:peptide subunit release factor 1 (eRF1)
MPTQQELLDRLVAFPPTTLPVLSLYLNTEPDQHGRDDSPLVPPELALELADEVTTVDLADELVSRARSTGATVSFIENPTLLAEVDGVAGLLRFTL